MSRVVQGGALFSIRDTVDEDRAIQTIRAAYDAGVREFDTARAYATVDDPTHNEELFRRALDGRRDAVIATKGGHFRVDHDTWGVDGSRSRLREDAELSLRVLGVDALPLYYLHRFDDAVALEESVGALEELRREGKIIRIGVCNATPDQLARSLRVAPLDAVQNKFSPREAGDRAVLELAAREGLDFYAYSPLGGNDRGPLAEHMPGSAAIADELGISFPRLTLAWLLGLSPALKVITGAGRPESARDSAAADHAVLTAAQRSVIDREAAGLTP